MSVDSDLIRKAQSGDMAAFTTLVQRHDRAVLALAARYVSSAEDAKDIYPEVLIKVFRGLPGFRFESEFSTWVHRIAVNTCLSFKRGGKGRNAVIVSLEHRDEYRDTSVAPALEHNSEEDRADRRAVNSDTAELIQKALSSLSPQQRIVFTLRHFEERPLKEIAQTLKCTEGTVKRYLFTATRRMRSQLQALL
jgi:RNA polymerase sigma-70 factor (ECF subfamily)